MKRTNADRRRRNWIVITAVLAIMVLTGWREMPERLPTPYFDLPTPLVIAHQGGNRLRPGNTLAAFDHALALGADVLELDVHASSDGHLVVIHDATVARTTDGEGAVKEMSLAQLKALDAGYHWPYVGQNRTVEGDRGAEHSNKGEPTYPYRGQGIEIPTFVEVLERYPQTRLNVEIKQEAPAIAAALCEALRRHRRGSLTLVASSSDTAMRSFRSACPEVATSASSGEVRWFVLVQKVGLLRLFTSPAQALQLPERRQGFDLLGTALVADADAWHLHVDYWTLNDRGALSRAIEARAGGIITDRPDLLLALLGR